jgi:hypothetical protein
MKIVRIAFFVLAAIELFLLLSGCRILVWQQRVPQGQTVTVSDWGEVQGDSIVCRYFTGRTISTSVFGYSPDGIFGKTECPLVIRPE